MTETISILIIFFVLVMFGLMFYSQYQKSALIKQNQEMLERQAIGISLRITYLPELTCEQTQEQTGACIDLYKLNSLKKIIKSGDDNNFYSSIFRNSHIYFKNIITGDTIDVYNKTLPDFVKQTRIRTPLLLRNITTIHGANIIKQDYFGVLYVDSYR